jgi:ATP-dependent Clp protease adaptor protein ClpS
MLPYTFFNSIDTEADIELLVENKEESQLFVFNDDVNTFDHVIESLVKVCNHTVLQADQCAHIIHYNGKCAVLSGDYADLIAPRFALTDRGLQAEII